MGDGQSVQSTEMRGNAKFNVGIFHMQLHDPFTSPGDPACDLPDLMEHAPFCLICHLYLIWKDLIFFFLNIFAPFKLVCFEAVIGLDVMHNYVSFLDFFIPQTIPSKYKIWVSAKKVRKDKEKIAPGNLGCQNSKLCPHVLFSYLILRVSITGVSM